MQDLYLDTKLEEQFKYDIDHYAQGKVHILKKSNNDINELLLEHLIKDIANMIIEYTNDVIVIDYDSYYYNTTKTQIISICSNDVFIDDVEYDFEYEMEISKYLLCKLIDVESTEYYNIQSEHDYFKEDYDILLFFNRYMLKEYGEQNYIRCIEYHSAFCSYAYDTDVYTLFSDATYINIKVINSKKLENVINICKLLIETIRKPSKKLKPS